jgi:hypothetical protein
MLALFITAIFLYARADQRGGNGFVWALVGAGLGLVASLSVGALGNAVGLWPWMVSLVESLGAGELLAGIVLVAINLALSVTVAVWVGFRLIDLVNAKDRAN